MDDAPAGAALRTDGVGESDDETLTVDRGGRVTLRTFVTLIAFILTAPGILRGQTNGHELAWA